jgi:ribosomal-protein-alanine N-acetyltransferase
VTIRKATADDLAAIEAVQAASPEAAQWNTADYLAHTSWVATQDRRVAGFLVIRTTTPGEHEILNLAVEPAARRRGMARALLDAALADSPGDWFLEVRESNLAAQALYRVLGFQASGRRAGYYRDPAEAAIVLSFHS